MIQIITYINPDLDGFACALGYTELLHQQGIHADPIIVGVPRKEVQFVVEKFHVAMPKTVLDRSADLILVDASDVNAIDTQVDPEQVVEVIDHRLINGSKDFKNAKVQIELVGAAATLIVEKFMSAQIAPSKEIAALLSAAIISNTINFHNNVTTERDRIATNWLKKYVALEVNFAEEMFEYSSRFDVKDWKPAFAVFEIANKRIGIAQLEIVRVNEFLNNNIEVIKKNVKSAKDNDKFDYCFLTCVDLAEYSNSFVSTDLNTREMMQNILNISFTDVLAKRDGIIMRKELVPLIKNYLEK